MSQIYPILDPKTLTRQVWDVTTARRIPGVGRSLGLYSGLISQMDLDLFAGRELLTRPRLLEDPDLEYVRSLFVSLQVTDYLLQGNAAHLVTARRATGSVGSLGWPMATRWYPATAWGVMFDGGRRRYTLYGREVNAQDVVHVQRGADPLNPARGVGVVEEFVNTFDRVALEEASERGNLLGGSVPSVAVVLPPGDDSTDEELDDQATRWEEKFAGPERRPGFLPYGSEVKPLAWNPTDAQMVEARNMSLTDVANVFNLDASWLGAKTGSHNYKSPGPLFLALLRTSLEGVLAPFEDTWSKRWVPRGKRVVFNRQKVLADDFGSTITALTKAAGGPVMTVNESRSRIQLGPVEGGDELRASDQNAPDPVDPEVDPENDPTTEEGDQQ